MNLFSSSQAMVMNSPFNGNSSMNLFSSFGAMQRNSPFHCNSPTSIFSPFGAMQMNSNQTSISTSDLLQDEPLIPDTSNQEAPIHSFYINGVNNTLADYQNTIPLVNKLLTATGINSQVSEETYNLSGKPKPINFDFAKSIIQAVTLGSNFEGTQFTNDVVEKIQNIDQENSLEDKFLIVDHSQGYFFAEDIYNQLPENIQERTRILAFSPFTDFQGISSDNVDYLLREDDFPNRLKSLPGIAVVESKNNLLLNYTQDLASAEYGLDDIDIMGRVKAKMVRIIKKPQELKILEITQKYPKQWVIVDVTQRDKYHLPASGKVLFQGNDVDSILDKSQEVEGDIYIFYTGSIDD